MQSQIFIFDFDNTLVDSLKYWYYVQNKKMFALFDKTNTKEFVKKRKGLTNLEIAQLFVDITEVDKSAEEIKAMTNEFMQHFYTSGKVKMLKGARQFLEQLKNEGRKLVIVSATDKPLLKEALKYLGIINLFDDIFTEQSVGFAKRDGEFFNYCFKKMKCVKEDVFFFEDSVPVLETAIKMGIPCCGVKHKFNKDRIDSLGIKTIKNYNKVNKIIK